MKISSEDVKYENERLSSTIDIIKSLIDDKTHEINSRRELIISGKKHLWQNMNEYNGPEMYSTMNEADLNVDIINSLIDKRGKLERAVDNPYFGRVDFGGESIYIGLTSVFKDKEYVYDWRAPISNLYYNFGLGSAYYDSNDGRVEGNIYLKRQYKIELGKLVNAFDSDVTVEDEMLQDVLLDSSDEHMKNIVSTIQKEQNEIIRKSAKKNLIIEGVAGSGKTSVALHRIAYLLYNHEYLNDKNVLIISPNNLFTSYISDVLPELGEENVSTSLRNSLYEKYFYKNKLESLGEFIERQYKSKSVINMFDIDVKDKIDEYVKKYIANVNFTKKIGLKDRFVTSQELNQMFHSLDKLSLPDRLEHMASKLCDIFGIDAKNAEVLNDHLKKVVGLPSSPIDAYKGYCGYNSDTVEYEHIAPIMYLYFEMTGYPNYSHIKEVFIDEAQDYSLLDFVLFKKVFNSAKFTILGDSRQSINKYLKYDNLSSICQVFDDAEYIKLDKTYRSTKEIIEYTNKILGIDDIKAVRVSNGEDVVEKDDGSHLIDDIIMLRSKYKRIAIICRDENEVKNIREYIIPNKDIKRDIELNSLVVIPAYLSKGLEFDAVIINDISVYHEDEMNILYVAMTRAQHKLIVYKK